MLGLFTTLDPLHHYSSTAYSLFWHKLFLTTFNGVGAKILSILFFLLAFYFITRKDNIAGFIVCILSAMFFAYFGGFLHLF